MIFCLNWTNWLARFSKHFMDVNVSKSNGIVLASLIRMNTGCIPTRPIETQSSSHTSAQEKSCLTTKFINKALIGATDKIFSPTQEDEGKFLVVVFFFKHQQGFVSRHSFFTGQIQNVIVSF